MNRQISELVMKETGKYMDKSRQELAIADEIYQIDCRDERELEARCMNLSLTQRQRMILNDYIACMKSANSRYSDLSYMAGIVDTINVLACHGLLNSSSVAVQFSSVELS